MKSIYNFIIRVAQEFEDRILDENGKVLLWLPGQANNRRLYGEVIAAPTKFYGVEKPDYALNILNKGLDCGKFVCTIQKPQGSFAWMEGCIRDVVEPGDTIWINNHVSGQNNYMGDNMLCVAPLNVVAYKKGDGPCTPYAGRVFIEPERNFKHSLFHIPTIKNTGIVKALGVPMAGQHYDIEVGDRVLYDRRWNLPFAEESFRDTNTVEMPYVKIEAKIGAEVIAGI
jgi:hypothetical protein